MAKATKAKGSFKTIFKQKRKENIGKKKYGPKENKPKKYRGQGR